LHPTDAFQPHWPVLVRRSLTSCQIPYRNLNNRKGIKQLRTDFYGRIRSQKDQTEYLVEKLRENRDPVSKKFRYMLPSVRIDGSGTDPPDQYELVIRKLL
jgi:hypothetical protein